MEIKGFFKWGKETKDKIAFSLFHLMKQLSITNISVCQICVESGVSSRTFYNIYHDKYEVVSYIYEELARQAFYRQNGTVYDLQESIFRLNSALYTEFRLFMKHALEYTGQNNIRDTVVKENTDYCIRLIRQNGYNERDFRMNLEDMVHIFVVGSWSLFEARINDQDKILPSLDATKKFIYQYLPQGVYNYFVVSKTA